MSSSPRRRFQCTFGICTRSFTRNEALQDHISGQHIGSKPFKCSLCEVCFVRKGDRNKHEKNIHQLIRSFCCKAEGCEKAYATRFQLKRHFDRFPGHNLTKAHPQTIQGTEGLIERLAEEIEWAVEYCDRYLIMINLPDLYAAIARWFRRLRQPTLEDLIQVLKSLLDATITYGARERDDKMSEFGRMFYAQWRDFDQLRHIRRELDEQELKSMENSIPTLNLWRDLLRVHGRTERERMYDQEGSMREEDEEDSTGTEGGDRLATAVDDQIYGLVQEQLRMRSPRLTLEWIKDSLRAALSAHEFCVSVQSGHTNSSLESVRVHSVAESTIKMVQ